MALSSNNLPTVWYDNDCFVNCRLRSVVALLKKNGIFFSKQKQKIAKDVRNNMEVSDDVI